MVVWKKIVCGANPQNLAPANRAHEKVLLSPSPVQGSASLHHSRSRITHKHIRSPRLPV